MCTLCPDQTAEQLCILCKKRNIDSHALLEPVHCLAACPLAEKGEIALAYILENLYKQRMPINVGREQSTHHQQCRPSLPSCSPLLPMCQNPHISRLAKAIPRCNNSAQSSSVLKLYAEMMRPIL